MSKEGEHHIGQRLSYDSAVCTVRYIGQVAGTSGTWLGVEWDDPTRGKHDGSHKDVRYFTCLSKSLTAASFIRPTRPAEKPRRFAQALQEKYAGEVTAGSTARGRQIVISGKVAEEIGFDKIRRQQAQLGELKIVILDGMRIGSSGGVGDNENENEDEKEKERPIREVCPKVTELDLSRNLFTDLATVVEICAHLVDLRGLRLNGNRFQNILQSDLPEDTEMAFRGVKELAVDETLLQWDEICHITANFSSLTALYAGSNQLSRLSPIPESSLTTTLTSIYLEFNHFTSLTDVASLTSLTALKNLYLKGSNISTITSDTTEGPPVFSKTLTYLDISYNKIHNWSFVDAIPDSFPGVTSLRLAHNPVYDNPGFGSNETAATETATAASSKASVTEEAYMITVGRLASLRSLNFSAVTTTDRTNAEMFYLSRIGRQLASVPDNPEAEGRVTAQHRRYAELCGLYGEPVVVRRREVNAAFLESRLINTTFRFQGQGQQQKQGSDGTQLEDVVVAVEKKVQIPKSFDIYAVKGIAGGLFGYAPLKLRLIWETGEWDPVAGFDEEAGDNSDDEEIVVVQEEENETQEGDEGIQTKNRAGRWVKREVELSDSPRQFGFCVDGMDVTIRVEPR